ncbi:hypothetical protein SCHPADRAFT_963361 [Schizopora paradoxa]|uniref:WD40 repeat-like protein n=1 Tax=Schizopora paradoxa TaxID=27342 RepID=A0A0H2RTG7_9AGAM|nr:hypothetical protein SCHPADRAFT_963361 [Schizopora paradoxa]
MNGIVSKWTQLKGNKWQWEKLLDSGDDDPACLAHWKGKIAVANPRKGVKLWTHENGEWKMAERFVPRKDVVTIEFMNDGNSLLCASSDGSVFACTVPEGRVQPVVSFRTKTFHLDVERGANNALITEACGRAHLVNIDFNAQKTEIGRVVQNYSFRESERQGARFNHAFGSIFTSGKLVVFASVGGKVFVWNRVTGVAEYEMNHGGDPFIQAVASFDKGEDRQLVSGIRQGKLFWWAAPGGSSQ